MLIFVFTLLLIIWELVVRYANHLLFILPSPLSIATTFIQNKSLLFFHGKITFQEMFFGLALAICASFPLATLMQRSKSAAGSLQSLFVILQCFPMFALAPLLIFWFGWSELAIIVATALMIFFPLTLNIYQGLRSTPLPLLEFFQTNGAGELKTYFSLRLPWALPHIFAGLKIAAAVAGIGAVAGEWAGGQAGLGTLMLESRRNSDLELTFSALFLLAILSLCFYAGVACLEKWRRYKVIVPLLLLLLTGCSKQSSQTRLLLDWLPCPNHIPLYVGIEKGFFAQGNIDLHIQKLYENGGIGYLASKRTDLLVGHLPSTLKALSKGAPLQIAAVLVKEPLDCFLCLKNTKELSGKKAGYCLGNSGTAFFDALLEAGHILPSEKINVGQDLIAALATRRVDFVYGGHFNIEPFQLASLGIETETVPLSALGVPPYYEMLILAHTDTSQAFIASFQKALQQSIDFCKKNPEEAFALYAKNNPSKREKTLQWERVAWQHTYPLLANDQSIDYQCIETFSAWMKNHQLL